LALTANFGFTGKDVRPAVCTVSEEVGDFVYVSGAPEGTRDQVRKADPSTPDRMPAVGVVIFKSNDTRCLVQWMGETPAIFTELVSGRPYYVGPDAKAAPAPVATPSGLLAQIVGLATSPTKFYVRPESNMTRLRR